MQSAEEFPRVDTLKECEPLTKTVLVAEDHVGIAEAVSEALGQWYHVLAPVHSLRLVPAAVTLGQPTIVLLDLSFGEESAMPLLPELIARAPETKFIVWSNHPERIFAVVARRNGAHGYLVKSASISVIRAAIEAVCSTTLPVVWPDNTIEPSPRTADPEHLTRQDNHDMIGWLLASGFSHQRIANMMQLSVKGVEYHAARLRREGTPKNEMQWE